MGNRLAGMSWLSDFDDSRKNNFTAIRLVMAWLVLFGHSAPIVKSSIDPLSKLAPGGTWIGAIAVDSFFAISGFLVMASFAKRSRLDFLVARLLRIYPGLIVCVLLSVFLIGPYWSSYSLHDYFSDPMTHRYLIWNSTLYPKVAWYLPGVFEDRPATAVNGSIWTLPLEVRCYVGLFVLGSLGLLRSALRSNISVSVLLLSAIAVDYYFQLLEPLYRYGRPISYFVVGALFWQNRSRIPLHYSLATLAAVLPYVVTGSLLFCLTYLVFFCAYKLPHLDADRFGDFSYGIYLYAWPAQQMVYWQGQSFYENVLLATIASGILAVASWNLIEKPALRLKTRVVRFFEAREKPS